MIKYLLQKKAYMDIAQERWCVLYRPQIIWLVEKNGIWHLIFYLSVQNGLSRKKGVHVATKVWFYLASCRKLEENGRFGNKNLQILLGLHCGKGTKRFCKIWL